MKSATPNLRQQHLESKFLAEEIWVDRPFLFRDGMEYDHDYVEASMGSADLHEAPKHIEFLDWIKQTEFKLSQMYKKDEKTNLYTFLRKELGSYYLLRLLNFRVGHVIEIQKIWRGYLHTVETMPLFVKTNYPIMHYVLIKTGWGQLIRENHNFGYHYHYSDNGIRRADIIFTFSRQPISRSHPATWEPHASGKSVFQARVTRWGLKKRSSVNAALVADLSKRCIHDYLLPGKRHQFLIP